MIHLDETRQPTACLKPKLSCFLLDLHRSLAHKSFAKILDISTGMPGVFANFYSSRSQHISSEKTAQLSLKRTVAIVVAVFFFAGVTIVNAGQNSLAIFNLKPSNIQAMGYDGEIIYALISALENEKSVEIMPRREMEDALFNAGLVQGGDPGTIAGAGRILGINFILFGDVTKKGTLIEAQLKLLDVGRKRVIKTWDMTFTGRDAIVGRMTEFAGELSRAMSNKRESRFASVVAEKVIEAVKIESLKTKSEKNEVIVTWQLTPLIPVSGFNVYRSEHFKGPFQFHGKTIKPVFKDSLIRKGKSYYYRIGILTDSGREIKTTQTVQVKSAGEKLPNPPLILSGKGYIRRIKIKFVPSLMNEQEKFKIQKYKIYRKKATDINWVNIFTMNAQLESQFELAFYFEDKKNLKDGKTYTYAVTSLDSKNRESPMSDPASFQTIGRAVLKIEKQNLLRQVNLSWTPLKNVEGYYLYRKTGKDNWQKAARITGASNKGYTDNKSLEDGQCYQYSLTAYDTEAETGYCQPVQAVTKKLPSFPVDILVQSGMVKSIRIMWTPVDDPDVGGYIIYRGLDLGENKRIAKVKGYQSHSFTDKGTGYKPLEDGKDYYYKIASFNLFGAEGKPSGAVMARTKPAPSAVKGLTVKAESEGIVLKWTKNPESDIAAYILYRSKNNDYWSKIKELQQTETTYRDVDLMPDLKYRYKIVVRDDDGLVGDPAQSDMVKSPLTKPVK